MLNAVLVDLRVRIQTGESGSPSGPGLDAQRGERKGREKGVREQGWTSIQMTSVTNDSSLWRVNYDYGTFYRRSSKPTIFNNGIVLLSFIGIWVFNVPQDT